MYYTQNWNAKVELIFACVSDLLGYCAIQYCACSEEIAENTMTLGQQDENAVVGSNCIEDWVEIEGTLQKLITLIAFEEHQ